MTEIATIDWFGRWGTSVFSEITAIFFTAGLKLPNLSQKVLVCTIWHELVGRFQPDLHDEELIRFW